MIFTASPVNQESLESDGPSMVIFTYYRVQELQHQNGAIPLSQAFTYVQQHVPIGAETEAHAEQNPVLSRSESPTDFSIGTPAARHASLRTHASASAE